MVPAERGFRVFLLAFSLWGWVFVPASLAFGATAEVGFVVRGDGGVEVTVSGRMESCTYCNSWGECWVQDRGRVVLSKGNRVLCSAEEKGWATCTATLDRGDLHGAHIFDGSAGDCQGSSAVRETLTLDNTPSLEIASPADGGVLGGPFDVRAKAVFKPTLNPVKGRISFYLGNSWYPAAQKSCQEEVCDFSYRELQGSLLDFNHGGPYRIHLYATVPGVQASDQAVVTMDKTPLLKISAPGSGGVLSGPFDVTATATFKPTLNPVKGEISLYTGNNYAPSAKKECRTESCEFSYRELQGSLLDFNHGGPYRIHLYATVPGVQASDQAVVTMDKTPVLKISAPGSGGVLSGPFDVTATASFKPTLNPVKGEISLYTGNNYAPSAKKECRTESCEFSYREVAGKLLDFNHGGPYRIHLYARVPGTQGSDQVLVTMDKTPAVKLSGPERIISSPFDVAGRAVFKPSQDRVKGTMRLYLDNSWSPSAVKECLEESCSFRYGEIMGSLMSLPPGGPHRVRLYAQTNGVSSYDEKTFTLVPCSLKVTGLRADGVAADPGGGGSLTFTGDLGDDSGRPVHWMLGIGDRTLNGEGKAVSAIWDGKDSRGKLMDPGVYPATLSARTAEGTCSAKETRSIVVRLEADAEKDDLQACFGSTVNVTNGNLRHGQTLFKIPPSRFSGEFTLSYNSLSSRSEVLGTGWTHTYNQRLLANNDGSYTLMSGDGSRVALYPQGGRFIPKTSLYPSLTVHPDQTGTLEHRDGITYAFNQTGQITEIRDRNGNRMIFTYADGKLAEVLDPKGRKVSLSYNAMGKVEKILDPGGNIHTFSYTAGDLTFVASRVGGLGEQVWTYSYYDNSFLKAKTDPLGNRTEYFYDHSRRVTGVMDPEGRRREIAYEPANSRTYLTEKDEGVWVFAYDSSLGVLKERTDPLMNATSFDYYPDRNLKAQTDPRGYRTSYAYDSRGNVVAVEDALGNTTRYTYNAFNQVEAIELDPREPQALLAYDERGNLKKRVDRMGVQSEYDYDARGNLTAIRGPWQKIGLEYDSKSDLTSVKDLVSGMVLYEFEYDPAGNRVSRKEGQKKETEVRYEYNGLSQVTRVTGPESAETEFEYDLNGNLRVRTDGNGNRTDYRHNHQGRVTGITDALGQETLLNYGTGCPSCGAGVDRLTSVTDARKQTTTFEYDQAGNLRKGTDPAGYSVSYTYDPSGNPKTRTDADGITTRYAFDGLNRLREIIYPDQSRVVITYDDRGNLKTAANADLAYTFTYDLNNRPTRVSDSWGRTIAYEYDQAGKRIKMIDPEQRALEYRYDPWNNLSSILVDSVPALRLTHDPYGRRESLEVPGGIATAYAYNPSGHLTALVAQNAKPAVIHSFAYTHDRVGNRRTKTDPAGEHRYDYDKIYQLIKAESPVLPPEEYGYDPAGNRQETRVDPDNALLEDKEYTYAYDRSGNRVERVRKSDGERTGYAYDFENRLIRVESPGMLARYKYDPFGRRIEKEVNGVVSRYVYDGPNILAEYDGDGKVKARYIHNLAVDDPLAMEQGGKTYYYHKDGLGSIVSMSDETGQTVQGYEYDSFGRILSRSGNIQNPFTYTGREYDEETGLYYYRARYYDPHPGRFLTKDPIGFAGGDLNLYRYVQNNPVNRIDPWGLYDDVGVHLIVTYQRALAKGIDPSTAWEIAWACRGVDKSLWTRPESPLALFTGQLWYNHFHPRDKWLEKRLRRSCEKQDPKEFGKNLHPLEDSFAHLEVNSGSRPYSLVAPFFHLADMNVDLYFENTYRDQKMLEALDYWLGEFSRSYYGAHPQNIPK